MVFCPNCRTEYTDEAHLCSDCQIPLIEKLPDPVAVEQCDQCGKDIGVDSDFCPYCGALFAEGQYSCTNHPIAIATAVCVVCQQLFCDECISVRYGNHLCRDHKNIEVSAGWAMVYKTGDFMEAEIMRGKIENEGIKTNPKNTANIAMMADGFIDNALGRTIFKYPIKIFVPVDRYFDALKVVHEDYSDHAEE